jgi:hypothetical protein
MGYFFAQTLFNKEIKWQEVTPNNTIEHNRLIFWHSGHLRRFSP